MIRIWRGKDKAGAASKRRMYFWWLGSYSIIILLSILINLIGYSSAIRALKSELEQSNQAIAEHIRSIYDNQFIQLQNAAHSISSSNGAQMISLGQILTPAQRQQYAKDAGVTIVNTVAGSPFVSQSWLLIRDKDICLAGQAITSFQLGYEVYFQKFYADASLWEQDVFQTMEYSYRTLTEADGTMHFFLYYVRPDIITPYNMAVIIEIDQSLVNEGLQELVQESNGEFYLVDREDNILFCTGDCANASEKERAVLKSKNGYEVSMADSAVAPIRYYYYLPYEGHMEKLNRVKRSFVLSYLLCLAAGGLLVVIFTKVNAKRRRQMEQQLAGQREYISRTVLYHLLTGKEHLNAANTRLLTENNIVLNGRRFVIVVFEYTQKDKDGKSEVLQLLVQEAFARIVQETASVYFCSANMSHVCIINFYDDIMGQTELAAQFETLAHMLKKDYEIDFACGISQPTHTVSHWKKAYQQATESLDARFLEQNRHVFLYEEVIDRTMEYVYEDKMRQELTAALLQTEYETAEQLLEDILQHESNRGLNLNTLRILSSEIGNTIWKAALQHGISEGFDFEEFFRKGENLTKVKSVGEAKERLSQMARELCEAYLSVQQNVDDVRLKRILDYLSENYHNPDLSVGMLADMFHISPSYMSRYFKGKIGEGLNDYIVKLRLEKAKELLRRDDSIPLAKVAEQVGFSSAEVFSRAFKRYDGVSPSRYRSCFSD